MAPGGTKQGDGPASGTAADDAHRPPADAAPSQHTNNPPSSTNASPCAPSPHKRRMSQSHEPASAATAATAAATASASAAADSATASTAAGSPLPPHETPPEPPTTGPAKRARPDVAPPKMLPEQYEFCPVEDMVVLIANMLGELIETNDALALKSGHLTRFHSRTAPGISVLDYLHRLAKHATLIPPLLLSMVYYIDRLCAMYPDFTINTLTVHRFLITAAAVAAKGLSDSFWNNSTYARIGGVRVNELKMLELEFLYRLEWKIVPNPEVLAAYYRPLVERCPGYALPPDHAALANSASPPSVVDGDGVDDAGGDDSPGTDRTPHISHHRQSSTSLIDRDMVISGLARPRRPDRG